MLILLILAKYFTHVIVILTRLTMVFCWLPKRRSVSEERFRSVSVEVTLGARSFSRALEHARTLVSHFRRSLIGRRILISLSETVPNVTICRPDFIGAWVLHFSNSCSKCRSRRAIWKNIQIFSTWVTGHPNAVLAISQSFNENIDFYLCSCVFLSRFGKDQSGDGLPPRIQMLSCLARHRTRQLLLKLPLIYNIVNTALGCPVVCATSLNSKYFPQQKSTKELLFLWLQYSYKVFQHRSAALSRF